MRSLGRIALFAAVVALVIVPSVGLGQQWALPRHDERLTGRAAVAGVPGAAAPVAAGAVDLGGTAGGALLGDVDGDGEPDAVFLRGGSVVAVSASGRVIFDRFVGATDLVGVADFRGTGRADVAFIERRARRLAVLDPRTQTIRWQHRFPETAALDAAYVRIADVSSSRAGLETVVFPDFSHTLGDAAGYFFDAAGSLYAQPAVKSVNGNQLNYPQMAIGDVDAKGDPEVVVVGRPKLLVFDSNGALAREHEFYAGDPEGRHYGTLVLADVDGDPELEAVVVADRIAPIPKGKPQAITVFDLAPAVRELWRLVLPAGQLLESVPNGAFDADGDGAADVAVNRFDGSTQSIEVYRGGGDPARRGQPRLICSARDAFAWDAYDLDGDARPELLASLTREERPSLSYRSDLAVFGARASGGRCALERVGAPVSAARYATRPLRALEGSDLASSMTGDRSGVATAALGSSLAVVTYTKDPRGTARVQFRSVAGGRLQTTDAGPRPGAIRGVAASGLFLVSEEEEDEPTDALAFYRWEAGRQAFVRAAAMRAGGFDEASPVVADLDGDGRSELVVRLPRRRVAAYAYDPASGRFTERWQAKGNSQPVVDATGPATVFVVAPDRSNRAMLVAHGGDGKVRWRARFGELPASARPEVVVGEFTGAPPLDVWVSAPRDRSWMVDGRDGRVVWESAAVAHFDNHVAVTDFDGDKVDDIVVVANDRYGVYSGRDGRPLVGPKDVRSLGAEYFSTPVLAGDGTMLLVARGTLAKASLDGKPSWAVRRETERTSDGLQVGVALDAKGRFGRVGGNFGPSDRFVAYDYRDGKVAFTAPHVPVTDVVTADTNADGVDEFIFGTGDGRIVALRADTGAEAWSVDVRGFATSPVVANLGGGGPALVVPVNDGTVRVFAFRPPSAAVTPTPGS